MSTPPTSNKWIRILVLVLIILLIVAWGCGENPSRRGSAVCETGAVGMHPSFVAISPGLCNGSISPEGLDSLVLTPCPDDQGEPDSFSPRIEHVTLVPPVSPYGVAWLVEGGVSRSREVREPVYTSHMMVRFHPVDAFDPDPTGYEPEKPVVSTAGLPDATYVVVLDAGRHGMHASSIIAEMLTEPVQTVKAVELETKNPVAGTLLVGDVPASAQIINVDIESLADTDFLVASQATILEALDALDRQLRSLTDQERPSVVVNMSFGTYNCGDLPQKMRARLTEMAEHGVTFAASAGNDETDDKIWPAQFGDPADDTELSRAVYSVGSVAQTQATGTRTQSCFSNYGMVEVWAVGEGVVALGTQTGHVGRWSGTSFAAPQVAAMLAAGDADMDPMKQAPDSPPPMVTYERVDGGAQAWVLDDEGDRVTATSQCAGTDYEPSSDQWVRAEE